MNFGIKINAEILHFYGAPNISDDQRFAELVGNQDGGLARKRLFLDQAIERGLIECPVLILLVDLARNLCFRLKIVHLNGDIGIPAYIRIRCKRNDVRQQQYQNRCDQYPPKEYAAHGTSLGFKFIADAVDRFDAKPDCIAKLQELTKDEPRMEVCPLQTKYPQGGERQLIYAVTGRAINSKMLPADAGCIVDNVETIIAIYNAVKLGKPVMNRVSTITGDAVANPGNFLYYIGTNYAELVEAAGGFKVQPEKIISGGPMMGFSMFSLDIPTTKTSSSLLCLAEDEVAKAEPSPCINCGRCVEACPEQLIPSRLAKMADHGVADEFEKWHGLECIECGSCSFACPAKRQLAQSIKTMKKQVLAAKRKK